MLIPLSWCSVAKHLLLSAILLVMYGCGSLTRELEQVGPNTAAIEVSIKSAFIESAMVDAAAVLVEFKDDTVFLSGFVDSLEESTEAERLATAATAGIPVINRLQVR